MAVGDLEEWEARAFFDAELARRPRPPAWPVDDLAWSRVHEVGAHGTSMRTQGVILRSTLGAEKGKA